jgi:hypothetical protein
MKFHMWVFSTQNIVNTDKSHFSQPISMPDFQEMQRTNYADYIEGVWACLSECNFPPVDQLLFGAS